MRFLLTALVAFVALAACVTPPPERTPPPPVDQPPEAPVPDDEILELFDPQEQAYDEISLAVSVGDPLAAIAAFEEAQLEDPDSPETRVLLANLYLAAGEIDAAEALLRDVLSDAPDLVSARYALSLIVGARGDRATQQQLLEEILELDPDHTEARAALGEIQLRNRSYVAAERSFVASLEQDPENLVALVGLANVKLRTDEPEQAEEVLSRAIEVAPEYSFAWADRSRARALQYELREAEDDLDQAVALDPDYTWHYYDRGLVRLQRNDFTGAADDFTTTIARDPSLFLAYVYRARALDNLGRDEEAIADYQVALELRPDYRPAHLPLGVLYFETEQFGLAALSFTRAWRETPSNDPRDPTHVLLAALSHKYGGDELAARRLLEAELPRFPRPSLYWDMARYYISPGFDGQIFRSVQDERDRLQQRRLQFYLAGQYEVLRRTQSARALYEEIVGDELRGYIERRLAETRLARLMEGS